MRSATIVLAAAVTATGQYCSNVNQYSCGAVLEKPDGSGVPRGFDLSSLCLDDGAAYYGELIDGTVDDKRFATNVCGNLADSCEAQQVCVAETDLPLPGITLNTGVGAECINDPTKFSVVGTAKEYGYLTDCAGATAGTGTCSRCNVLAQHTNSVSGGMGGGGTWSQIQVYSDGAATGEILELKKGVQVVWPTVLMGAVQNAVAAPNKPCKASDGWTVTQQFFCDCDQTSMKTTDIFASKRCGANNDEQCGVHPDGNGKCSSLMKFGSRAACYTGFCSPIEMTADSDGLTGAAKFAIVLGVFVALFVLAAYVLGARKQQEGFSGNVISLGSTAIFAAVCCYCQKNDSLTSEKQMVYTHVPGTYNKTGETQKSAGVYAPPEELAYA